MKIFLLILVSILLVNIIPASDHNTPTPATNLSVVPNLANVPLFFIPNRGQVHPKAQYYAKCKQYNLWVTKQGLTFDRFAPNNKNNTETNRAQRDISRMIFIGASENPAILPIKPARHKVNYFKGKNKNRWHTNIPTSLGVLYKNLYKGIDLEVYGQEKQVEYDWIIHPGGNPGNIRFHYRNIRHSRLDKKGNLQVHTPLGRWTHQHPTAYQDIAGERIEIEANFKQLDKGTYGFRVGSYDKNFPLVIDPVVLVYSTYLGGTGVDRIFDVAVDHDGYVYVTGLTFSEDFPVLDEYQGEPGDGVEDMFITKLDPNFGAAGLMYSSYLGGDNTDYGTAVTVDGGGMVYISGVTQSTDFPTVDPYMTDIDDSVEDAFVVVLDPGRPGTDGLRYSTYLGGTNADTGLDIAVDGRFVYVTGDTLSDDFPVQDEYQVYQGAVDAFVTKLDISAGGSSALIYSTYLGGGNGNERGYGIAVDKIENVYLTGYSNSTDFPLVNEQQTNQPGYNAFVSRIDTTQPGTPGLVYSTCLGGEVDDQGGAIAIDSSGNAYVTGETASLDFPMKNAYQSSATGTEAFVTQIDTYQSGASSLVYSTYLGGGGTDTGMSIAADSHGYVFVSGETNSTNFPTADEYQTHQGNSDAFITKLAPAAGGASSLVFSTYLGGESDDAALGIALDGNGFIYTGGYTDSGNFPTVDPYQTAQGDFDGWVAKLAYTTLPTVTTLEISSIEPTAAQGGGNVTNDGGAEVTARGICWSTSQDPTTSDSHTEDGTGTGGFTSDLTNLDPAKTYYVRAYATNSVGTAYGNEVSFSSGSAALAMASPNGGEIWEVNSSQTITWTSDGGAAQVALHYSVNNGGQWMEITASTTNDGSYGWTVPSNPSAECLVRVTEFGGGASDSSDAMFTIVTAKTLTVTSPDGGEDWPANSRQMITWDASSTVGNLDIDYTLDNGQNWMEIARGTPNDGQRYWTLPNTPSTQCRVRVSESQGALSDTSDEWFTISSPSTITVTSPNGGETWNVNTSHSITWNTDGTVGNVTIEFSVNSGGKWRTIVTSTANDGTYNWAVPDRTSTNCLVRISEWDNDSGASDVSNAVFTIQTGGGAPLTVTSPNGGETLLVGSMHEITWTGGDGITTLALAYSTDRGANWAPIVSATSNDGSFYWNTPNTPSGECLVRISGADTDGTAGDSSNSLFAIAVPAGGVMTLTSPNGSEKWEVDGQYPITWSGPSGVNEVALYYSVNGGASWTEIVSPTPNDGSYDWTVPSSLSSQCLVFVKDVEGTTEDAGDAVFSIVTPLTLTVTVPNGGEQWQAGTTEDVTWTSTGTVGDVTLEYSADNGQNWTAVGSAPAGDGLFNWYVPDTVSTQCLMRVTGSGLDGSETDESDNIFAISAPAGSAMAVLSPNGGESWLVGAEKPITWQAVGTSGTVKIEYSSNAGNSWNDITTSTPDDGSYPWTIPDAPSTDCLVRVTDTIGDPTDVSNTVFSIVSPGATSITVTSPNGGETLPVNGTKTITWTSSGGIDAVDIEYSPNSGANWAPVKSRATNNGSYDWKVADTPSETCLVRISDADIDGGATDNSDEVFSIVSVPDASVTVTAPNGGEVMEVGSFFDITWVSAGEVDAVNIEYTTDRGATWSNIATSFSNDAPQTYNWLVPNTVSDVCRVRIRGTGQNETLPDSSDGAFSIIAATAPSIHVTAPNGGENLPVGTTFNIAWTDPGNVTVVDLEYSTNNGNSWTDIEAGVPNTNTYEWTVPNAISPDCLVRVSDADSSAADVSDEPFAIDAASTATVTVTSPNGGETLTSGNSVDLTWTSNGVTGVIMEYSTDGGTGWSFIAAAAAADGSYDWTIPNTPSTTCLVRIAGTGTEPNPVDVSDAVFTIVSDINATLSLETPNGGEQLTAGDDYNITWGSTGITNVTLFYSTDGGDYWNRINTVPAADGTFTWNVPDEPSTYCLIRITETGGSLQDESNTTFSIVQ